MNTQLESFLKADLRSADEVLARFAQLPGAIFCKGKKPLERFVYIPGSRENKLVLIAHADTIWDNAYGNPQTTQVAFADGVYTGTNPACGIGADDRAGCAMLWALRNSGHSLLLTDGEEKGKHGARFLRRHNGKLFREINRHQFLICLDAPGYGECLYNQVDYTAAFRSYITEKLGFPEGQGKGGSDLQFVSGSICGVNIGVGYHGFHRPQEQLVLSEWEDTLHRLSAFLEQEHPRFPIHPGKRFLSILGKGKWLAGRAWKKLKRMI